VLTLSSSLSALDGALESLKGFSWPRLSWLRSELQLVRRDEKPDGSSDLIGESSSRSLCDFDRVGGNNLSCESWIEGALYRRLCGACVRIGPTGGINDRDVPEACCLLLSIKSRSSWPELRRMCGGTRGGGEDELLLFDDILRRLASLQRTDRQKRGERLSFSNFAVGGCG
jgi:hypothetical protein